MLIKDIVDAFGISPKIDVPMDKEITFSDISNGKYFPAMKDNKKLSLIVTGLSVNDGDIEYANVVVNSIDVDADGNFPPCGGSIDINVVASFSIHRILLSGGESNEPRTSQVSAVAHIVNGDDFTLNGNKLSAEENNTDADRSVTLLVNYYYGGSKFSTTKVITQRQNKLSQWKVYSEPTDSIAIFCNKTSVSKDGGKVDINVEREYSRVYVKEDLCGNVVEISAESGLTEDITHKCFLTSSNNENFAINGNHVIVSKQTLGAFSRRATITARYLGLTDSIDIVQEDGGKVTYKNELSFKDGKEINFLELSTALKTTVKVPIVSMKYKYADGEFVSVIPTNEVYITSDKDWAYGVVGEDDDGVNISVRVTEDNLDKTDSRECSLTITSTNDETMKITLVVLQPPLVVKKDTFSFTINNQGEFTSDEIDDTDFIMKPRKLIIYENGSRDEFELEEGYYPSYDYFSTNDGMLRINGWQEIDNSYLLRIMNGTRYSIKDIDLNVRGLIKDSNNNIVFESKYYTIKVKGNTIIEYKYELCFDNHAKDLELTWSNEDDENILSIKSIRHKIVNGKEVAIEDVPYIVTPKNAMESKDFSFTSLSSSMIKITPYKINESKAVNYYVKQLNRPDKLNLTLNYLPNNTKTVLLSIILHSNVIEEDIWTGEGAYVVIDDKTKISLKPCWLYPTIKNGYDVAYSGSLELTAGEHKIETFNLKLLNYKEKTHRDINEQQMFNVNEDGDVIVIKIEV